MTVIFCDLPRLGQPTPNSLNKRCALPRDTFKTYVERHVTRRKLSLKLIGYCRQSSYTDSEVVFTLLPAVAWVLKSQFAPGYMHFNKCFEGVSGKRELFLNGKLVIEVFFLSRPAIDFSYILMHRAMNSTGIWW